MIAIVALAVVLLAAMMEGRSSRRMGYYWTDSWQFLLQFQATIFLNARGALKQALAPASLTLRHAQRQADY